MRLNVALVRQQHEREGHGFSCAEAPTLTHVIPSEEDRSQVNDLHRRGTCFSRSPHDGGARTVAGLSTSRIDSQATRFAPLEMTVRATSNGTTEVVPCRKRRQREKGATNA